MSYFQKSISKPVEESNKTKYIVEYFVKGKRVGFVRVQAISRRDAYYDSMNTEEYSKASTVARKRKSIVDWDAREIN